MRAPLERVKEKSAGVLHICVTGGWRYRQQEVYPIRHVDALPSIRGLLRQSDADVTLSLAMLMHQVYENGPTDKRRIIPNP